jgi:hypothetical protein
MSLSKKKSPIIPQDTNYNVINKVVEQIYDHLNELINAVNQGQSSKEKVSSEGKSGDIQVVRGDDGKYYLDIKTDEGWVRSTSDTFKLR